MRKILIEECPLNRVDIDASNFHRLFYPVVPVVITASADERVGGMPAIWCTPLSFTPPMIGAAIAPDHQTYQLAKASGFFGVNWLDSKYALELTKLVEVHGKDFENKLEAVGFHTILTANAAVPTILEASASAACSIQQDLPVGTHNLLIGKCMQLSAVQDFADYWLFRDYHPMLYAGTINGKDPRWLFAKIAQEQTFTVPRKA